VRGVNWDSIRGVKAAPEKAREAEGPKPPPLPEGEEARMVSAEKPLPFSFVKERHLGDLAYLLREEPVPAVAVVVNYLEPELATRLMDLLPKDKQVEVAMSLSRTTNVSPEKVEKFEATIKSRLDYVLGGDEKLSSILNLSGDDVRDRVMHTLQETDAETAERMKRKVKSFEGIMRGMGPQSVRALYRQMEPTVFAQVLKSSPADIQKKVLESLSEGAAERMKEEMDLTKPLNKNRMRREKLKILTVVRKMTRAGLLEEEDY
jgi:flagellar motor switch protein FliG